MSVFKPVDEIHNKYVRIPITLVLYFCIILPFSFIIAFYEAMRVFIKKCIAYVQVGYYDFLIKCIKGPKEGKL